MLKRVKKEKKISLKTKNKKHKVITKKEKEKDALAADVEGSLKAFLPVFSL